MKESINIYENKTEKEQIKEETPEQIKQIALELEERLKAIFTLIRIMTNK